MIDGARNAATPGPVAVNASPGLRETTEMSEATQTSQALDVLAALTRDIGADQIEFSQQIGTRIGRRQTVQAMRKLVTVTELQELQQIKDSKQFKGLRVMTGGKVVTVTTWDDFCTQVEGRSREQVDEDLRNLNSFGAEMLEAFQHLGVGYRRMRDLRAVPAEARVQLIEAAKAGDPKALMEAAEDLIEHHTKECTSLREKVTDLDARCKAKDDVIATKDEKINSLDEAEARRRSASRDEREQAQLADLRDATVAVEAAHELLLSRVDQVTSSPATESCNLSARQALDYVGQRLVEAAGRRMLTVDLQVEVAPLHMQAMQAMRDAVIASRSSKPSTGN